MPQPTGGNTSSDPNPAQPQPQQAEESDEFLSPQEDGEAEEYGTNNTPVLTEADFEELQGADTETVRYDFDLLFSFC